MIVSATLEQMHTAAGVGETAGGRLLPVHQVDEWADGGQTNVDTLTFPCGAHHRLITPGGWKTRKQRDGSTEWLPPPHLPLPGGTNTFHHPGRMLPEGGEHAA